MQDINTNTGQIKQPNPFDLPINLDKKYKEIEQRSRDLLETGKFEEASSSWEYLYKLILEQQKNLGYRLHKGGIVHNLGIIALLANNTELSFKNFILGFAEDVASQEQGFAGDAEEAPGAQNLKTLFGVDKALFNLVRKIVKDRVSKKKFDDPRYVFRKFWKTQIETKSIKDRIQSLKKTPFIIGKKYTINRIPNVWNNRVFIGGNYSNDRLKNLLEIKKAVIENGYTPIIALEFNDQEPSVHDHSLLLLHNCKYAIFDVSKDSGYLMEVERTFDYRTKTLFVYEAIPENRMTAMILSLGKELKKFSSNEELHQFVNEFFKSDNE